MFCLYVYGCLYIVVESDATRQGASFGHPVSHLIWYRWLKTAWPQAMREWLVDKGAESPVESHDGAHTSLVSKLATFVYAVVKAARLEKRSRMGSDNLTAT